ncbi:GspH/FimT family pseudopilin [uncultured Ferrimonas sp.]|uniref:GspH/FimT family pseudopilin n=1 Tax=uncultured Ferrimonas sp. TaxID=432640 RepID=UPI00261BCB50|nr:GspH/FimT family pseudopilin [uncultured Ferrimonas sp.]
MHTQCGRTLIELLIAIAIATILLGIGRPVIDYLLAHSRASTHISQLYQDLNYARQLAVSYQNTITVCPINDDNRCSNQWQHGYSVFIDTQPKGRWNEGDEILQQRAAIAPQDFITASRTQVRFSSDGFTYFTGSIRYCPLQRNSELRQQVTISATGGIRYHPKPKAC